MSAPLRARAADIIAGDVLHPQLAGSHFAHAASIALPVRPTSALQVYLDMARQAPRWLDGLMRVRNAGMRRLGMKDLGALRDVPATAPAGLQPGQRLGIFSVHTLSDDAVVLGDADRHLQVLLSLQLMPQAVGCELKMGCVVHLRRPFGRLYMLPVAPLHRRIVPHLLERYRRGMAAPATG